MSRPPRNLDPEWQGQRGCHRVSKDPAHGLRWWAPGETIPPDALAVRAATPWEVTLIQYRRSLIAAADKLDEVRRGREERTVLPWPSRR